MKRIFLLLFIPLWTMFETNACGPFERGYLACDYDMFRACGDNLTGSFSNGFIPEEQRRTENCREWAALTSTRIPLKDILQVVYKWDMSQLKDLDLAANGKAGYKTPNQFASWIAKHGDSEISAFLLLAKRCERVRLERQDPWYYATDGDDESTELQDIIDTAKAYHGSRLRDRYALQVIRALFSSYQYGECLNVWMDYQSSFKDNVLKEMTLGYVAGAHFHLGDKKKAMELYLACGDKYSACQCAGGSYEDFYDWMTDIRPNDEIIIARLQSQIHRIEDKQSSYMEVSDKEYEKIYTNIKRVLARKKCANMAAWYYAAAFVAEKLGKKNEAKSYMDAARAQVCPEDLRSSIRVLDIYLKVKYAEKYDQEFENGLFPDLVWLDKKIVQNMDDSIRSVIQEEGFTNHITGRSQYYWNDMMRKIVISELVPLCLKSGYTTRALQYLNMADNRIFNLVSNTIMRCRWKQEDGTYGWAFIPDTTLSMRDYRMSEIFCDDYDYRNDFFMNLDSVGVKYVQRLAARTEHPLSPLDRFLNARGYADRQYLYDIIGTQLIAAMRYKEAIPYLRKVTAGFNKSRNVYPHCNIDPFTNKRLPDRDAAYKLHFAQKMYELEKKMKGSLDPNDRAEAVQEYAYGLQNSVGEQCWPLTSFYWGSFFCFPFYSQHQRGMIDGITKKAEFLKNVAFSMFTDDERAAKACYKWQMYHTVTSKYKNTKMAEFVLGHCDNIQDYQIKPALPPRIVWEEFEKEIFDNL